MSKMFAFDPKTGESKVYDFENPDKGMLKQMCDVLLNRLGNPAILRMLYNDQNLVVPNEIRAIVQEVLDNKITQDEARTKVLAWKESL